MALFVAVVDYRCCCRYYCFRCCALLSMEHKIDHYYSIRIQYHIYFKRRRCCSVAVQSTFLHPPLPPHHNMQLTYHRHPLMDLMSLRWKRVDNMVDIVLDLM
jgi:hypothetical protein